jgi:hypothetical protein
MSYKHRWQEPSDRVARDEYRALRRELKLSRTSKARRTEIENRLDEISPIVGTKEPSLEKRELKPTTRDLLALCDRVEAARETAPVSSSVEADINAWLTRQLGITNHTRAIQEAASATPAEKAEAILSELPEHPLNKLARELEQYLWNEDMSLPKPDFERQVQMRVRHWLSAMPGPNFVCVSTTHCGQPRSQNIHRDSRMSAKDEGSNGHP